MQEILFMVMRLIMVQQALHPTGQAHTRILLPAGLEGSVLVMYTDLALVGLAIIINTHLLPEE